MNTVTDAIGDIIGSIFGSLFAILGSLLLVFLVGAILLVISIICNWRLFVKMGEPGWKSLIPIYNIYVMFQHIWGSGWMFLTMLIPIFNIIIALMFAWKTFKRFGKSALFCLLGLFFYPICLLIIAFDNSTFIPITVDSVMEV